MYRIDHPTAVAVAPTPAVAGTPGYFTEGDPVAGVQATIVTGDWANSIQEELAAVVEDGGGTLDKSQRNQVITAIKALFSSVAMKATELVQGTAKVATQSQTNAGTDDATIVTPKKLRWGVSYSIAANGYVAFPSWLGGWILQWAQITATSSADTTWTYPIAFPSAAYFAGATVALGGATGYANLTALPGLTSTPFRCSSGVAAAVFVLAIGK